MKSVLNAMASALSVILFVSCQAVSLESSNDNRPREVQLTVNAVIGLDSETKTQIQSDEKTILWTRGDAINLFYGATSSGRFETSIVSPAAVASFTGSVSVATGTIEVGGSASSFWGVYPYNESNTCNGSSVVLTFLSSQCPTNGSFQDKCNPTIAKSDNLDLAFYNVGSWFAFSVEETGIVSATFRGNSNEDVAGKVQVSMQNGRPVIDNVIEGHKTITITAPDGGFVPGNKYYISLIPQTFSNGYSLELQRIKEESVVSVVGEKTFTRNIPRIKLDADHGLVWTEREVAFKDPAVAAICLSNYDSNGDGKLMYSEIEAVTNLGSVFKNNTSITSFDELQYFTSLGYLTYYEFQGCTNLKSVTLSSSTLLNNYSFQGCTSLESVKLLCTTMTKVSDYAFDGCSSLKYINIPDGVTTIGKYAFRQCTSLQYVNIPSSVTTLDSFAFAHCQALLSINLGHISHFYQQALAYCENLTSFDLSSCKYIGSEAFMECTGMTSISIPNTVTYIGQMSFVLTSIEEITIPSSVTAIQNYTFQRCYNLRRVYLPSTMGSIGNYVFYNCPALERIEIPRSSGVVPLGAHNFEATSPYTASIPTIYVPSNLVNTYRNSSSWSDFADHIVAFP